MRIVLLGKAHKTCGPTLKKFGHPCGISITSILSTGTVTALAIQHYKIQKVSQNALPPGLSIILLFELNQKLKPEYQKNLTDHTTDHFSRL